MKKLLLLLVPLFVLVAIGGGVWWKYGRNRDPYALAQTLMDKGDLRGAQLELKKAVSTNPRNVGAHYRLGQVELRLGDAVAAEKELRTARDMGFDARTVNPLMAQAYMAQGRYRDLLRDFTTQGLQPDQTPPLLVMRALAQLSTDDIPAAQTSALEAERLAPQSVDPQIVLGRVAIAKRDFAAAEQKIDRALVISPRSTEALLLKGQLLNLKGDRIKALESFDATIAVNPNMMTARLERANALLISGKDEDARKDIEFVLKAEPRSAMANYLDGVLRTKAEDYTGADAAFTKIGNILARFPRGFYFLAVVKYNLGQAEQAADAATHFLARNSEDPDAVRLFARVELAARRAPKAIDVLTKAIDNGQVDADTLDLLGRAYALSGRPAQAIQSFERAAALAPDNAEILTRLASIRMGMGDSAGAAKDLQHSLEITPGQKGAAEGLVVASIAAGEIDKAALALARMKAADGDTAVVGNLTGLLRMAQLDLAGAETVLSDTVARFPTAIDPRLNLAKVLIVRDKSAEAQRMLDEVLVREPTNPMALGTMVTLLLADARVDRAISRMETARAAAPTNADVVVGLANLYIRANDARKALALIDESLKDKKDPAILEPLLRARAGTQLVLGMGQEARDTYRRLLDVTPADVGIRRSLADLLVTDNQIESARTLIAYGLRDQPGNGSLLQSLVAIVFKASGLDAALALADQLARDPTNLPAARTLRGDIYMAAGRFANAAAAYAVEFKTSPTQPMLLRQVAALSATGRTDEAGRLLRDWLARYPTDTEIADTLSSLDIVARRFYEAEQHLQVVLAQRPGDAGALNNLAWVYQQRNDPRARATAQKAYLLAPTPQSADTLGWILTTQGEAATGLTLLRQAASQLAGDATVQYHLAVALKESGKREDAIAILRVIVFGQGDFDEKQAAARLYTELTGAK